MSDVPAASRGRVITAAVIAIAFAGALLVVAGVVIVDAITNHGNIGVAARDTRGGRSSPASGVFGVTIFLVLGAWWLVYGARRALRRDSYVGIVAPLGIVLVIGTIGETIDLLGTASGPSDLIGAGILVMAAIPVALLWRPFFESRRS